MNDEHSTAWFGPVIESDTKKIPKIGAHSSPRVESEKRSKIGCKKMVKNSSDPKSGLK
jgi:hypothetical protein